VASSSSGYSTLPRCPGSGKYDGFAEWPGISRSPLHHHSPQRESEDHDRFSTSVHCHALLHCGAPLGRHGCTLCQQSTYGKRTRSPPTTTTKGCGLRHFCMFCGPNQNNEVFDADSPGPARQWSMSPWAKSTAKTCRGSRTDFRRISPPYRHGSQHGARCAGAGR
jgi:hypothetical protein